MRVGLLCPRLMRVEASGPPERWGVERRMKAGRRDSRLILLLLLYNERKRDDGRRGGGDGREGGWMDGLGTD